MVITGVPAAPGRAVGRSWTRRPVDAAHRNGGAGGDQAARARLLLAAVADDFNGLADRLREEQRTAEAEIVETGALIAADPELEAAAVTRAEGGHVCGAGDRGRGRRDGARARIPGAGADA